MPLFGISRQAERYPLAKVENKELRGALRRNLFIQQFAFTKG